MPSRNSCPGSATNLDFRFVADQSCLRAHFGQPQVTISCSVADLPEIFTARGQPQSAISRSVADQRYLRAFFGQPQATISHSVADLTD